MTKINLSNLLLALLIGSGLFAFFYCSKERVPMERRLRQNYEQNRFYFDEIMTKSMIKSPVGDLAIHADGSISCYLSNQSIVQDTNHVDSTHAKHWIIAFDEEIDSIFIDENRAIKGFQNGREYFSYQDNWSWEFKGDKNHRHFANVLKYLGLDQAKLLYLKECLTKIDCNGLSVSEEGNVTLIYRGNLTCHYGYYYGYMAPEAQPNFTRLDSSLYCGMECYEVCGGGNKKGIEDKKIE